MEALYAIAEALGVEYKEFRINYNENKKAPEQGNGEDYERYLCKIDFTRLLEYRRDSKPD